MQSAVSRRPRQPVGGQVSAFLESPELLRPAFQPMLSLGTGEIVGYEGFSRFLVAPSRTPTAWFAEATRVGLGPELQAHAMRRIIESAEAAGIPDGAFLSLNVSPRYLGHSEVEAAIGAADPLSLVVELTEEEAVFDYRALRRVMAPYIRRGIRFAVDDAGAGFASMRHVIELQPAFVKLDASLIRGMGSRQTLRAFLRAISGFASEIGATLVAEGVERAGDLVVLTETGFPILAQGFGIARPGAPWPAASPAAIRACRAAARDRR